MAFTAPGQHRLWSTKELLELPPPTWLVDGVLPSFALAGLVAPSGIGKTFLAIDISMCIATGRPWHGMDVEHGSVLYISAEGGLGIGKRVSAWLEHHKVKERKARIAWLSEAIPIHAASPSVDVVLRRIEQEVDEIPTLVVIDTLARCLEGDENTQQDMGSFIAGCDWIRNAFGATVLVIHHTGRDETRERGSTSLKSALDTMILAKRNPDVEMGITLSCGKQKDWEDFASMEFVRKTVQTALRDAKTGDWVHSQIVEMLSSTEDSGAESRILGLKTLLLQLQPITYSGLRDAAIEAFGSSVTTFKRDLDKLKDSGAITQRNRYYRLAEN